MGDNVLGPGGEDVGAEDLVPSDSSFASFASSKALDIFSIPEQ